MECGQDEKNRRYRQDQLESFAIAKLQKTEEMRPIKDEEKKVSQEARYPGNSSETVGSLRIGLPNIIYLTS